MRLDPLRGRRRSGRGGIGRRCLASKALVTNAGVQALPGTNRDDTIQEVLDLANHYTLITDGKFDDVWTSTYSFARAPVMASSYGVAPWDGTKNRGGARRAGRSSEIGL
jgi:hypothetical protein